jgi:hypothetical protein
MRVYLQLAGLLEIPTRLSPSSPSQQTSCRQDIGAVISLQFGAKAGSANRACINAQICRPIGRQQASTEGFELISRSKK